MRAFVIDAFDYCRQRENQEGQVELAELPRLAEETVDRTGLLRWSLRGGADNIGHPQLTLNIAGNVKLMCQRCLLPFSFDLQSESRLVIARNEATADELDALLADEEVEVIVGSKEFNAAELIEDEALLALPLSPKHAMCPDMKENTATASSKPSPFAVLKDLKKS